MEHKPFPSKGFFGSSILTGFIMITFLVIVAQF